MLLGSAMSILRIWFQSAPLTEARGDAFAASLYVCLLVVSIRSPHRSKGRFGIDLGLSGPKVVSIRSPHRSKGRCHVRRGCHERIARFNPLPSPKQGEISRNLASLRNSLLFQSAPLTEARGDQSECRNSLVCRSFNPLPSPKQGEIPSTMMLVT